MPIVAAEEEGNGDLQSGNRGAIYARDSDREAVAPQRHRYQQGDQRSAPADSATWWRNEHRVEESEKNTIVSIIAFAITRPLRVTVPLLICENSVAA
jgi:hypothetical protein